MLIITHHFRYNFYHNYHVLMQSCNHTLQNRLNAINVDKATEFVLSCMNFDGGFGCRPGSESHAGQVK